VIGGLVGLGGCLDAQHRDALGVEGDLPGGAARGVRRASGATAAQLTAAPAPPARRRTLRIVGVSRTTRPAASPAPDITAAPPPAAADDDERSRRRSARRLSAASSGALLPLARRRSAIMRDGRAGVKSSRRSRGFSRPALL
jgi:hypothetical protein